MNSGDYTILIFVFYLLPKHMLKHMLMTLIFILKGPTPTLIYNAHMHTCAGIFYRNYT